MQRSSTAYALIPADAIQISGNNPGGWYVLEKPALWKLVSAGGIILTIYAISRILRKYPAGTPPHDLAWPLAIILVSLLNPISWSYHYLPAVVFAPALLDYYKKGVGAALLALLLMPLFLPLLIFRFFTFPDFGWIKGPGQVAATLGMIGLAAAFAFAMRRKPRHSNTPDSM